MSATPVEQRDRLTRVLGDAAGDLLMYLRRRVAPEDAADLVGETMLTAWRRLASLPDDDERTRMWLFGIARNHLLNHHRVSGRRAKFAAVLRALAPTAPSASSAADDGAEVRDAIARLDPDLAEIVRLVHWDGFTLAQAAEVVGVPASTARGRYQRARAELRAALLEPAVTGR